MVRFAVAGLEVCLRSPQHHGLKQLAGFYDRYPSAGGAPDLILDVETIPGITIGQHRGPDYPAFQRQSLGGGRIRLSRFDGQGELDLPQSSGPVRGRFQIGESANTLEAVVRIGMSVALPRRGALLVHASAIAFSQRAWVFAGVSGAGKSTISTMLASALPECRKLSDELLIAAPAGPGDTDTSEARAPWLAYATPFIGGSELPHGACAPITGVYFLAQAKHHECLSMSRTDGLRELMRHVLVYVAEPTTASYVLDAAARWVEASPCHRLRFAKDPGVASVLGIT
jgi:hypothetical protein